VRQKKLITIKDVEHVAKLARLAINDKEKEVFTKQLADIVNYFNMLNEVDTENVEPMAHAVPIMNVLREDEVEKKLSREEMLAISPFEEDGFIRVPKITE
jgi:aspartyl-tRNA(Asn)/glutamyl-tRNA(Gln) amidotransferase subunit C